MPTRASLARPSAKPLVFGLCLLPFAWLLYAALTNQLGANPAEALIRSSGDWALRFLCIALSVTPLRVLSGVPHWARYRRMLGLYAWFYAFCHACAYAVFDMGLDAQYMLRDLAQRPFILVGFISLVILCALAATSTSAAIRTLGGKRWRRLHQLVYLSAGLAMLHFFWMRTGKQQFGEVAIYGGILSILLGWRVLHWWQKRRGGGQA